MSSTNGHAHTAIFTSSQAVIDGLLYGLHRIRTAEAMSHKARSDAEWAFRQLLRCCGCDPRIQSDSLPTTAQACAEIDTWLRNLRQSYPELNTANSRVRSAFRALGVALPNGHGTHFSSEAWADYIETCQSPPYELAPFAGACTREGIEPSAVSNATLVWYKEQKLGRRLVPDKTLRRLVACFNLNPLPGCGEKQFVVPGVVTKLVMRADLHPDLGAESKAWSLFRQNGKGDLRKLGKVAADRQAYLMCLMMSEHLNSLAAGADDYRSIAVLVHDCDAAKSVLNRISGRSKDRDPEGGWGAEAYECGRVLCQIARSQFLKSRGGAPVRKAHIAALRELVTTFSPKVRELPARLVDKLRHFTDFRNVLGLQQLPSKLVKGLKERAKLRPREKIRITLALTLMLIQECPELACRLASLRGSGVRAIGSKTAIFSGPAQASTDRPDAELSEAAQELYRLQCIRVLDQPDGPGDGWVFPGRAGSHKHPAWFSRQIVALTARELGIELPVRDLRWVYAFIDLAGDVDARDLAAGHLGHNGRQPLDPLVELVEDWRKSGAFQNWPKLSFSANENK